MEKHTVWRGDLPVIAERSAPYSEVKDLHDHEAQYCVDCKTFDEAILLQAHTDSMLVDSAQRVCFENLRQSVVHNQETGLDCPYGDTLHLLDNQNHLTAVLACSNIGWSQRADVEIRR